MAQTKLAIVIACVIGASACGGESPTRPDAVTPPASPPASETQFGVWKGAFAITSCSGPTDRGECQPTPDNFVLRLGPDGGVLQIETRVNPTEPAIAVDVARRPGSAMTFAGTSATRNVDVQLTLTEIGPTLQGTVHYSVQGFGLSGGRVVKDGRILFANRDATIYASRFEGQWVGVITRTQCSGDCLGNDAVLQNGAVRLLLSQAGGSVSGTLNRNELTGTANGTNLTLTGRYVLTPTFCQRPWDGGSIACLIEISVTGSVDSLDRLRGSITYRVEGLDDRSRPYAMTASGTLDGLARWP